MINYEPIPKREIKGFKEYTPLQKEEAVQRQIKRYNNIARQRDSIYIVPKK